MTKETAKRGILDAPMDKSAKWGCKVELSSGDKIVHDRPCSGVTQHESAFIRNCALRNLELDSMRAYERASHDKPGFQSPRKRWAIACRGGVDKT